MEPQQVLEIIKKLAKSSDLYGRLYSSLMETTKTYGDEFIKEEFYDFFKNCKDEVDVIKTIEY